MDNKHEEAQWHLALCVHGEWATFLTKCQLPSHFCKWRQWIPVKVIYADCNCQSVIKGKAWSASLKTMMREEQRASLFPGLREFIPLAVTKILSLLRKKSNSPLPAWSVVHRTSFSLFREESDTKGQVFFADSQFGLALNYTTNMKNPAPSTGKVPSQPQIPQVAWEKATAWCISPNRDLEI